jgi:CHAT domain-containing protein
VSSYTPSLSILLSASHKARTSPALNAAAPSILVVSQAATPGQSPLPGTVAEVAAIRARIPHGLSSLDGQHATVDAVLHAMKQHRWVHLACHGVQHDSDADSNAALSGFLLHDGRLSLLRLMSESLENAELAVLSACQTATGETQLPEESMHISAGLLSVGYKSVIGTLWSIGDSDGPIVADAFYASLLEGMGAGRSSPAYALHDAGRRLKAEIGEQSFARWVPFVHFGV